MLQFSYPLHPDTFQPDAEPLTTNSRLAIVQVGLWEIRRRWLSGETEGLDLLLENLDEDVEHLRSVLGDSTIEEESVEMASHV